MRVYTSGEWHVKPGREEDFTRAWRQLAESSGSEFESNEWSFLLRDSHDPRHFRSLAGWGDEESVEAWRSGEGYKRRIEAVRDTVEQVDISMFEMVTSIGSVPESMITAVGRH